MFPTGTAGAALFVLRVLAAATFVVDGTAHWAYVTSFWTFLVFAAPALLLCLGLLTPYCSTLCAVIQLVLLLAGVRRDEFHLVSSIVTSGILIFVGPGAYSVDARLFGRRLLSFPPSR